MVYVTLAMPTSFIQSMLSTRKQTQLEASEHGGAFSRARACYFLEKFVETKNRVNRE